MREFYFVLGMVFTVALVWLVSR